MQFKITKIGSLNDVSNLTTTHFLFTDETDCARDQWLYNNEENSRANLNCASSNGADAGVYFTFQYYGDIGVYCVDEDGVRTSPLVSICCITIEDKFICLLLVFWP